MVILHGLFFLPSGALTTPFGVVVCYGGESTMRYHTEPPDSYSTNYGETYICNHPVYSKCTLFLLDNRGLAIIQQRFNPANKQTWWSSIDPWLNDLIYLNPGFPKYFDQHSWYAEDGLYPTVSIRQIMWALKMKPLKRERWETVFDRKEV